MKGIICRQLYGEFCDHRPSGDEDILIHKSEYESVEDIFIKNGYFPDKEHITEEQKDELQEITFSSTNTGLTIEVHLNLMGYGNQLQTKMNAYFESVFDNCIEVEIDGVPVITMCATDHFQYLVLHAFRHFWAGGFGVRQVLGILLFDQKYTNEIDRDYIARLLREVYADKFLGDLIHIGNKYLGFRLSEISSKNCPDELLEDLFYCGIFGNETHKERTALELTKAAVANVYSSERSEKTGSFTTLGTMRKLVFPSKRQIINSYPELEDKPWKLPVCWGPRWLKYLKYRKLFSGNLAVESMKISKQRIELLKKYDIL